MKSSCETEESKLHWRENEMWEWEQETAWNDLLEENEWKTNGSLFKKTDVVKGKK